MNDLNAISWSLKNNPFLLLRSKHIAADLSAVIITFMLYYVKDLITNNRFGVALSVYDLLRFIPLDLCTSKKMTL
jgi:hypothetical protein